MLPGLVLQLLGASYHNLRMLTLKHVMPFVFPILWYAFEIIIDNLLGCHMLDRSRL